MSQKPDDDHPGRVPSAMDRAIDASNVVELDDAELQELTGALAGNRLEPPQGTQRQRLEE